MVQVLEALLFFSSLKDSLCFVVDARQEFCTLKIYNRHMVLALAGPRNADVAGSHYRVVRETAPPVSSRSCDLVSSNKNTIVPNYLYLAICSDFKRRHGFFATGPTYMVAHITSLGSHRFPTRLVFTSSKIARFPAHEPTQAGCFLRTNLETLQIGDEFVTS